MLPLLNAALLGIAVGSPAGDLRARLGDPLLVEHTSPLARTADYLRPDDVSAVLRVTEERGVVFAVEIERERPEATPGERDEDGIALGMSRADVLAKRGTPAFTTADTVLYYDDAADDVSTIYRFDGDMLEAIKLLGSGTSARGAAGLPHLDEAAGSTYASAILDVSPSVVQSDHFRDRYLVVHDCAAAGRSTTIDRRAGRTYAVVDATCAQRKRALYFDVTEAYRRRR